jgi:hypothetical protein
VVLRSWHPEAGFSVLQGLILVREVDAVTSDAVLAPLGQRSGTSGELGADGCVLRDPIRERIFAVLNDAAKLLVRVECIVDDRARTPCWPHIHRRRSSSHQE